MSAKRKIPAAKEKSKKPKGKTKAKTPSSSGGSSAKSTLYAEFTRYVGKKSPPWHPVKKMRYIFFRMIGGLTITDALREIHWSAAEFWHLVDLKRHGPFREEFKRAKKLQGRSFADSVVTIAEGRDRITRRHQKRIDRLIAKAMRKIAKSKSTIKSKMIFSSLMQDLREHDKIIMTRNKLQVDASKWMARVTNPQEFSESSRVSLGSPGRGDDGEEEQKPILIQFVGRDGKVVNL